MCPRLPRPLRCSAGSRGGEQKAARGFRTLRPGPEARSPAGCGRNLRSGRSRTERAAKVLAAARIASGGHSTGRTIQTGRAARTAAFNKPWDEDRKPRPAPRRMGLKPHAAAFTPRTDRPAFGSKPRFEGRSEGFSGRSNAAGDSRPPRREFTPRAEGEAPRKTFSKPGTFGRKREGASPANPASAGAMPSAAPRLRRVGRSPPRRDFGGAPADAASGPRWRVQASRLVHAAATRRLRRQARFQRALGPATSVTAQLPRAAPARPVTLRARFSASSTRRATRSRSGTQAFR